MSGRTLAVFGQAAPYRGPSDAFFLPGMRSMAVLRTDFDGDAALDVYTCLVCGRAAELADLADRRITRPFQRRA